MSCGYPTNCTKPHDIKQSLGRVVSLSVDIFTSGKRDGYREAVVLLCFCGFSSVFPSALLGLYLFYTLDFDSAVAGGVASCFGALLTVALFLSKGIRCLWMLFVISMFMKKSRNLLLTAGMSIVVLNNIHNTLHNLKSLVMSMTCNLKAKKEAIIGPFGNYIEMLKTIGRLLKGITDLGVLNLDSKLKVSPRLESEKFNFSLSEAQQKLNKTVEYAQALMETVTSVTHKMFPAISILLLVLFIALHMRRYCSDMKYKNKFISRKFVLFDEKQKAEGKPHVLPLTPKEEKLYTHILSISPTQKERRRMMKFGMPILSHSAVWVLFIAVDALMFYFVDVITKRVSDIEPFHVPLIQSFITHEADFSFSVSLFEKKCLPEPKLQLDKSIYPLSAILLSLLIMTLFAAKVSALRLAICERFFTDTADERVEYLHRKILRKRFKTRLEEDDCSLKSLILKPHFWFPLRSSCYKASLVSAWIIGTGLLKFFGI
uniref:Dendrocyte expressed seven transmembrane protein n=1 Tax=Oryzias sinensis TaxID=183150 RepID=A0A8C7ZY18_9TELE